MLDKLQQALSLHQQGHLAPAKALYEELLVVQPENADALHLLGVIAAQTRDPGRAVKLIGASLRIKPGNAPAHFNRGTAFQALRQWAEALTDYDSAIAIQTDFAEAHCNRCVVQMELGQLDEALASADRAIALRAGFAEAHFNRGNILYALGRREAALASYDQALALRHDYAEAFFNRGNVLKDLDRDEAAVASYDQAIAARADFAAAYSNRGSVQERLLRWAAALDSYDRALAIKGDDALIRSNRANVLTKLGRFDEALLDCDRAIAVKADLAAAHCSRGNVLAARRQWQAALASYERALSIDPGFAEVHFNGGNVCRELEQWDAALASYDRAIALRRGYAEAYCNRGLVLVSQNRLDEALRSYDEAIRIRPNYPQALYNRSFALLLRGDLESGWRDQEWRWSEVIGASIEARRSFREPRWLGEFSIAGKTILLHAEQGLGDTLQFCRYAKLVAHLGARVLLEVQEPLVSLLANLEGVTRVIARGQELPPFDCWCPLLSLPLVFKTTLSTIPAQIPYLSSDAQRTMYWKETLGMTNKLRVGLVWSGGIRPDQPERWAVEARRNIPLAMLASLKNPDVEFYSLQKGQEAEAQLAELTAKRWDGPPLIDFTPLLQDFSDTAALMANLDLIVSVDTSTAHLAGALGKPVWILNRFDSCWRWLLQRSDTPWYPTARLYRQADPGDWGGVVRSVGRDLKQWASVHSGATAA